LISNIVQRASNRAKRRSVFMPTIHSIHTLLKIPAVPVPIHNRNSSVSFATNCVMQHAFDLCCSSISPKVHTKTFVSNFQSLVASVVAVACCCCNCCFLFFLFFSSSPGHPRALRCKKCCHLFMANFSGLQPFEQSCTGEIWR
jgi:hypothetical protein